MFISKRPSGAPHPSLFLPVALHQSATPPLPTALRGGLCVNCRSRKVNCLSTSHFRIYISVPSSSLLLSKSFYLSSRGLSFETCRMGLILASPERPPILLCSPFWILLSSHSRQERLVLLLFSKMLPSLSEQTWPHHVPSVPAHIRPCPGVIALSLRPI